MMRANHQFCFDAGAGAKDRNKCFAAVVDAAAMISRYCACRRRQQIGRRSAALMSRDAVGGDPASEARRTSEQTTAATWQRGKRAAFLAVAADAMLVGTASGRVRNQVSRLVAVAIVTFD